MLGKFNSHYSLENGIVYRPDFPIYLVYVHTTCSNSLKDSPVFQKPELLGHPFLTLLSQGGFITKNPLNYFLLKVTKFHGDIVLKLRVLGLKNYRGGAPNAPACLGLRFSNIFA